MLLLAPMLAWGDAACATEEDEAALVQSPQSRAGKDSTVQAPNCATVGKACRSSVNSDCCPGMTCKDYTVPLKDRDGDPEYLDVHDIAHLGAGYQLRYETEYDDAEAVEGAGLHKNMTYNVSICEVPP